MSDYTAEQNFEGCRQALQQKSKYYWLGTVIMYGGIIFALLGQVIALKAGLSKVTIMFPIMGIVIAIAGMTYSGWPVIKACLMGGLFSAIGGSLKADYEVITVDEYGNRTSDGGTESIQLKALANLVQVFVIWAIAPLLVSINIIILTIKGFALKAKARVKSTTTPTIGFLTIRNVIVAISPVVIIAVIMGTMYASIGGRQEQRAAAMASLSGNTLTVFSPTLNLRSEPSGAGSVVKTLKKNDRITATGNVSGLWVPVESGKDKGFVFVPSVRFQNKTMVDSVFPFEATAAASVQAFESLLFNRGERTIQRGEMVTVTASSSRNNGETCFFYIKIGDTSYEMLNEAAENLVPKLNADGSIATIPKE
jgi:hypothetical protein